MSKLIKGVLSAAVVAGVYRLLKKSPTAKKAGAKRDAKADAEAPARGKAKRSSASRKRSPKRAARGSTARRRAHK